MRVISAGSAAAILDTKFKPLQIVASAAVSVKPPYREPSALLGEPIFREAEDGYAVIVHEAELCRNLLDTVEADVVHLDMSLGAFPIEELSPIELANMKLSNKARQHLLKILPKLRPIAGEIRRKHGLEVLAIGKESVPVRIAELTAGAHAIAYACAKVADDETPVFLGLPSKCQYRISGNRVYLHSLMAAEHDVRGYAECAAESLGKVNIMETLNPCARGFRALKITPKS
ncbi:MAG: DUF4152 family protein [Candidatus Bathyarchaeota archaeon]|nr:DUF4152 family protein [Candidatus Bathyarchaeota archaeon]